MDPQGPMKHHNLILYIYYTSAIIAKNNMDKRIFEEIMAHITKNNEWY